MWQVRDDRQHQIMMLRIHDVHIGSASLPESRQSFHRLIARRLVRCQDAPAIVEQRGKTGVRAGLFGTRDRVAGDEMDAVRNMRAHLADDRSLCRADVRQNCAGFQRRGNPFRNRFVRSHRHTQNDEIRPVDRLAGVHAISVAEPELLRAGKGCLRTGGDNDLTGDIALTRYTGKG